MERRIDCRMATGFVVPSLRKRSFSKVLYRLLLSGLILCTVTTGAIWLLYIFLPKGSFLRDSKFTLTEHPFPRCTVRIGPKKPEIKFTVHAEGRWTPMTHADKHAEERGYNRVRMSQSAPPFRKLRALGAEVELWESSSDRRLPTYSTYFTSGAYTHGRQFGKTVFVDIPLWLLIVGFSAYPMIVFVVDHRRRRRSRRRLCIRCAYNLVGLTERRCPECGTAFEA